MVNRTPVAIICRARMQVKLERVLGELHALYQLTNDKIGRKCLHRAVQNVQGALTRFKHHNEKGEGK